MSINVERADNIELGEYMAYVSQIRGNEGQLSDEAMIKFMKINPNVLSYTRRVISEHPDWDDEEVAEEVLFMED